MATKRSIDPALHTLWPDMCVVHAAFTAPVVVRRRDDLRASRPVLLSTILVHRHVDEARCRRSTCGRGCASTGDRTLVSEPSCHPPERGLELSHRDRAVDHGGGVKALPPAVPAVIRTGSGRPDRARGAPSRWRRTRTPRPRWSGPRAGRPDRRVEEDNGGDSGPIPTLVHDTDRTPAMTGSAGASAPKTWVAWMTPTHRTARTASSADGQLAPASEVTPSGVAVTDGSSLGHQLRRTKQGPSDAYSEGPSLCLGTSIDAP